MYRIDMTVFKIGAKLEFVYNDFRINRVEFFGWKKKKKQEESFPVFQPETHVSLRNDCDRNTRMVVFQFPFKEHSRQNCCVCVCSHYMYRIILFFIYSYIVHHEYKNIIIYWQLIALKHSGTSIWHHARVYLHRISYYTQGTRYSSRWWLKKEKRKNTLALCSLSLVFFFVSVSAIERVIFARTLIRPTSVNVDYVAS